MCTVCYTSFYLRLHLSRGMDGMVLWYGGQFLRFDRSFVAILLSRTSSFFLFPPLFF